MKNQNYFQGEHITTIRDGGVFQYAGGVATNATIIIYTIGANYEILLTQLWLSGHTHGDGDAYVSVWNATPALVYRLPTLLLHTNASFALGGNLIPPINITRNFTIRLTSTNVNVDARCDLIAYRYAL